ncbi:MAG: hypothetical protein ACK5Q5_10040 [Planctomycetaceae bacterium]
MLSLLTTPAMNERGPRWMEKVLAAVHQGNHRSEPVTLHVAAIEQRVGLFVEFPAALEELVCGPITASYPNCSLTTVAQFDPVPAGWSTWTAAIVLSPELFPILRHAQFEDLNRTFADPIDGILRSVRPTENLQCRFELRIVPSSSRRVRTAEAALRLLDREFFHRHYTLAEHYARTRTRPWGRVVAGPLGLIARQTAAPSRTAIDTSTSRLHEREEHLQAAADKIGGHLFETELRLIVHAPPEAEDVAQQALRQMFGALGAFTKSHLATFRLRPVRSRDSHRRSRRNSFLASHEELATLFHPPTANVAAEGIRRQEFRELEPPAVFPSGTEPDAITLGRV